MKILVLNCGSSSVKFQLFNTETEKPMAKGLVERIGTSTAKLRYQSMHDGRKIEKTIEILDHTVAIRRVLSTLQDKENGAITQPSEIDAVGHRVVHGGETFSESVLITQEVYNQIDICADLAPLHNPPNLKGISACQRLLPNSPQVAVFDTAFHQTMPKRAWIYAVPAILYKRHAIRRYGFHGTSHFYVSRRAAEIIGKDIEELKIITAHLGNGCSITAIKNGKSVDTSMGMTPLEGLVMGTRCGDIDPAVITHIMAMEELRLSEINAMMNKHSGLYALSGGLSNDMRELTEEAMEGNAAAQLAIDVFVYRLKKYIGAYAAAMGGLDALVFTGGIGENAANIRGKCCENMEFLGIRLDKKKNAVTRAIEARISEEGSPVQVLTVPTAEELVIALDTQGIVKKM
ncbi:MAG: acetate kinase [Candidatus Cloacimonetes bacterium 4572_55]|nr:MAG: acetate kinase [Candidatus Cloacimonetes bacterium 4572_55]